MVVSKCHPLRRLWFLFASSAWFLRSPTRCKKSTFSKYPPLRLFVSSSEASSGSPDALACASQSSADFSKVESFFPFREAADGSSANCNFGLRRPGRLLVPVGGGCVAVATEDDDDAAADGNSSVDGAAMPRRLLDVAASSWPSGGFHRGHFLASFESSGTSTISLSLRSQRSIGRPVENGGTHTTSSPANR
jgi:hypothetical protein